MQLLFQTYLALTVWTFDNDWERTGGHEARILDPDRAAGNDRGKRSPGSILLQQYGGRRSVCQITVLRSHRSLSIFRRVLFPLVFPLLLLSLSLLGRSLLVAKCL